MKIILLTLLATLLLSGCMNTYFEKFGGFPLESETLVIRDTAPVIKLMITYRYPYQTDVIDTTSLNVSVNVIVSKDDMARVSIDRLALSTKDNSYLMSYAYPAVYDTYANYPIVRNYADPDTGEEVTTSDQPCLFTVSSHNPEYIITLYCRVYKDNGSYESFEHTAIINISEIKRRTNYL